MRLSDLRKELNNIRFELLREDKESYFEAVVVKNELKKLTLRLEQFLGSSTIPSKLTKQLSEVLQELGGVWPGQSLYCKSENNEILIALLWPWSDGERTTVKIIRPEEPY